MPKPEENPGHGNKPDKPPKPDHGGGKPDEGGGGGTPTNMFGTWMEGLYTNVLQLQDGTLNEEIAYGPHVGEVYAPGTFVHAPLPPADLTVEDSFTTTYDDERINICVLYGGYEQIMSGTKHLGEVHSPGTFPDREPLPVPLEDPNP